MNIDQPTIQFAQAFYEAKKFRSWGGRKARRYILTHGIPERLFLAALRHIYGVAL